MAMRWSVVVLVLIAGACSRPSAGYEEWFAIPLGESVVTPAGTIRFERVIEDTRCPPEADCVADERVSVELTLEADGSDLVLRLNGLLTPNGTMLGSPPGALLPDDSWLWITDLGFHEPVATFYLNPPPRM
jgi:hypothetical protein